jgi:hypothetical protein
MIVFMLLISRHGKTRLNKYYKPFNQKERTTIQKEVIKRIYMNFMKVCENFKYIYVLTIIDKQYDNW